MLRIHNYGLTGTRHPTQGFGYVNSRKRVYFFSIYLNSKSNENSGLVTFVFWFAPNVRFTLAESGYGENEIHTLITFFPRLASKELLSVFWKQEHANNRGENSQSLTHFQGTPDPVQFFKQFSAKIMQNNKLVHQLS